MNAFTSQELSIVSSTPGTTTDPVYKAMELLPLGPVVIIDTAGIDDEGILGEKRIQKTRAVLNKTDLAILVSDATEDLSEEDNGLIKLFEKKNIPYVSVRNKADLLPFLPKAENNTIYVSAKTGFQINELKEMAAASLKTEKVRPLVSDLISKGDTVVLVTPIDKSAPKGRLILPQQQTIRDILDSGAAALVCRETELESTLRKLVSPPKMVITDSQVFGFVKTIVPEDVPLTSFSILMARYKGNLPLAIKGARAIDSLKDGDKVLISEGCTHHRQCEDIGTVKIPNAIRLRTGVNPEFHFTSGGDFPEDLSRYKMVIHCGACTLREKEVLHRLRLCEDEGVPVTNYGVLLAYLNGILPRTLKSFPNIANE